MAETGEMKRRMLAGELFRGDPELEREVTRAATLCDRFNSTPSTDRAALDAILAELLGEVGEGVTVKPPFRCDYGYRTSIGSRTFLNWDCLLLDGGGIVVGDLPAGVLAVGRPARPIRELTEADPAEPPA